MRVMYNSGNKLRGIVGMTIEDMFAIHDMKIIEGDEGYFLAMPSRRVNKDNFADICHPVNSKVRESLERLVFDIYEKVRDKGLYRVIYQLAEDKQDMTLFDVSVEDFDEVRYLDNYEGSDD